MVLNKIGAAALLLLVISSCTGKKDEQINAREESLRARENAFKAKEQDYARLIAFRDSIKIADSLSAASGIILPKVWPDSLAGEWNGKMLCRESSCKNYVIGDQRTEKWIFSNDSLGLIVKVMDNEKLKRQLRAELNGKKIRLSMASDTTTISKIRIEASLDEVRSKLIKGSQSLNGKDNCTAKFSVELTPASKK